MTHLPQQSPDLTARNIEALAALFPSAITESRDEHGQLRRAINFEQLRQLLTPDVLAGDEAYEFTWVGKKAAMVEANRPIRKTLRPCKEESKAWDTTENLYIEGDNLDVLKLLQESYLGKVKIIYIDPPYNTGNDFIYRDDFSRSRDEEEEQMGMYDEEDNRLFRNTDSNGRFHSDWCSMIYSRLMLARGLLTDDGVIFISIDDNEVDNLRKICNEAFGESNFIAVLVWEKKKKGSFLSNSVTNIKEYILVYCKEITIFRGLIGEINTDMETYPCINAQNKREVRIIPAGIESKYKAQDYYLPAGSEISDTTMSIVLHSDLIIKNGYLATDLIVEGNWRYSQSAMSEYASKHEIYITRDLYLRRIVNDSRSKTLKDILYRVGDDGDISFNGCIDIQNLFSSGWGSNEDADEELRILLGVQKLINYPKPVRLILKLLASYRNTEETIVLDFFSGSATTAHAVMKLNAEDGGHRKFIMVQLPEPCDEASEAYKAGYRNICEIGKERIRRAGDKIKAEIDESNMQVKLGEEPKPVPDIGFRVLKLADTNMKDVYYSAGEYTQELLATLESNIKEDRTDLDLLFGCLLDWGVPLSMPYVSETLEGCAVHTYGNGTPPDLIACFAPHVPETVVRAIAERQPLRVVFRDSSFAGSPQKINVTEIFKVLAPNTSVKVI